MTIFESPITRSASSQIGYEARGTIFEFRMVSSRVSKGTAIVHDACSGDDLIGRIAAEVKAGRNACNGEVDGPDVQSTQDKGVLPRGREHVTLNLDLVPQATNQISVSWVSYGRTRATGLPRLVTIRPSASNWSNSARHCSLNFASPDLFHCARPDNADVLYQ